jgi:hypothetical protein
MAKTKANAGEVNATYVRAGCHAGCQLARPSSARQSLNASYSHLLSLTLTYSHLLSRLPLASSLTAQTQRLACPKPTNALPWSSQTSQASASASEGHQRSSSLRSHSILTLTLARPIFPIFPISSRSLLALHVHHGPQTPPRQRQRRRGANQSHMDFRRAIRKCARPLSIVLLLLTARSLSTP